MTIGLGSGRAVWKVVETIASRWPAGAPLRAAVASGRTEQLARGAGIDVVELDGEADLDLLLDGADEVDGELCLIKGGGGALLREKILAAAARRFVVVAEASKRVERLGERRPVPIEVVRFGWRDTARRLRALVEAPELRLDAGGRPYVTEEGHYILDGTIPLHVDAEWLASPLDGVPGVVEHGLFIGMADFALLGQEDGRVEGLRPPRG
jgi:ribose 5-phosphate isomerase A